MDPTEMKIYVSCDYLQRSSTKGTPEKECVGRTRLRSSLSCTPPTGWRTHWVSGAARPADFCPNLCEETARLGSLGTVGKCTDLGNNLCWLGLWSWINFVSPQGLCQYIHAYMIWLSAEVPSSSEILWVLELDLVTTAMSWVLYSTFTLVVLSSLSRPRSLWQSSLHRSGYSSSENLHDLL